MYLLAWSVGGLVMCVMPGAL